MKIVKWIGITLLLLAVLFVIIGVSLPDRGAVKRSVLIKAPVAVVFENVNNLRNHEKWDPWQASDKTMRITYGPVTAGTGASYSWTSRNSGAGTQTITESVPDSLIKTELVFADMEGAATGWFRFAVVNGDVLVTEGFTSAPHRCFCGRYLDLLISPEVGKQFVKGLNRLKELSETGK